MVIGVCSVVAVVLLFFFFQAEDGIRDLVRSRGLGDVYKRQNGITAPFAAFPEDFGAACKLGLVVAGSADTVRDLSLIHI